jgi:hypothetical protein
MDSLSAELPGLHVALSLSTSDAMPELAWKRCMIGTQVTHEFEAGAVPVMGIPVWLSQDG